MKYHFKYDNRLFPILDYKSEEEEKIGFSRTENYFTYQGLDRMNPMYDNSDNNKYAKIFIRVDNKKVEIKKKYQSFLDFYAENSSFWFDLFWILNLIISIMYNYVSNLKLSQKLFIFEGIEDSKTIYKKYIKIRNKSLNTESVIFEERIPKDKTLNNTTIIEKNIGDKSQDLSQYSIKSSTNIKPDKNDDKKINRKPISLWDVIKVSICCCCNKYFSLKEQLIKQSIDIIEKKLDIFIYIRNMILIDIMYKLLIDDKNKAHINFLSRIFVYKRQEQKEKEEELNDFYKPIGRLDLKKLYKSFYDLENKNKEIRTETEKKIVKLFYNQFN